MKALRKLLKEFAVPNKTADATLGSIKGGLWRIPESRALDFCNAYATAYPKFTKKNYTSLVFRPATLDIQPLLIDLDFRSDDEVDLQRVIELTVAMCKDFCASRQMYVNVVAKQHGYWSKLKKGLVYKTGVHLYTTHSCTIPEAGEIRKVLIELVPKYFCEINYTNTAADVVDEKLTKRCNGLMLIGDYKHKRGEDGMSCGGRYMVRAACKMDQNGARSIFRKAHL